MSAAPPTSHRKPTLYGTALMQLGYRAEGIWNEGNACKVVRPATAPKRNEASIGPGNFYTVSVEVREVERIPQLVCANCECGDFLINGKCKHGRFVCGLAGWIAAVKAKYPELKGYGLAWCYYLPAGKFSPPVEILTLRSDLGSYIRFSRVPGDLGAGIIVDGPAEAIHQAYLDTLGQNVFEGL